MTFKIAIVKNYLESKLTTNLTKLSFNAHIEICKIIGQKLNTSNLLINIARGTIFPYDQYSA